MKSAQESLFAFMKKMTSWEKDCAARTDKCIAGDLSFEEAKSIATSEYAKIFREFCSTDARMRDLHYSIPPEYDPEQTRIECISNPAPNITEIETRQDYGHKRQLRFRLQLENGEWRLCEKRVLAADGKELDARM